jgi:multiple antibiotic resistance protein
VRSSTSANILVAILLNMVVVLLVLLLTARIERLLGRVGLIVMRKAFGIILLAISREALRGEHHAPVPLKKEDEAFARMK